MLENKPPLVDCLIDAQQQVQPNGIDLTLRDIAPFISQGILARVNANRVLSEVASLDFGKDEYLDLQPGCYLITYNEIVHIPENITALGKPRSSLLRCGVTIETAVWDAGYEGRSQSLLVVHNPSGFRIQKNARVLQLIFFKLSRKSKGYKGIFQKENI